ncbi:MAG TPA: hypothetical protein VFT66_26135 [Roseiflexaceae bacterium]|nr:hypothetical protein [Roseiflexaceae bacterium]
MLFDQHPLLSAGAGQAERRLPDEAVVPYCDALGDRLGWLDAAFAHEQAAGRLSAAGHKATHAFLHEIRATLMVMTLKHGRQLLDVEPLPLTIDPTESGMPTVKDFWLLHEERDHAQEQLAQIPSRDGLIADALDTIYSGRKPVKQQILWLQRAYMERLAATPVVTEFRQMDPVRLDAQHADRTYAVSWTGIIRSVNLFECTTLHYVERGGWHVTGGTDDLRKLIDQTSGGRNSLQEIIGLTNEAAWIVPQTIERVTIGPYNHEWTENDEGVQAMFAAANGAAPFAMRARIERAATTRAAPRSTFDSLLGREPMEAGPTVTSHVLLVPLAIKQHLGTISINEQPCAVYGVTGNGDLVS